MSEETTIPLPSDWSLRLDNLDGQNPWAFYDDRNVRIVGYCQLRKSAERLAAAMNATSPARQDGAAGQAVGGPGGVPNGCWIAPKEPTLEMVTAAYREQPDAINAGFSQAYRAMREAAPKAQAAPTPPATASDALTINATDASSTQEAALAFIAALDAEPEKDCWDTESGEEEPGAQKFPSDWSWADWHDRKDAALLALRNALTSRATAPQPPAPIVPEAPVSGDWPEDAKQAFWRLKALHEARMRLIGMVVQQERARNGEGKAWNGSFYAEQLALLSKKDLEPCMACGGTGCEVDPETGHAACDHCSGDGVFVPFSEKA